MSPVDYAEQCQCGHSRAEHIFEPNEDSIVCEECDCGGFDAEPREPYIPDEQDFDIEVER